MELFTSDGAIQSTYEAVQRLRQARENSSDRLAQSTATCFDWWESRARDSQTAPASREPVSEKDRESVARERLLEWEAQDLMQVVPGEMDTERRRFAMRLYETAAIAQSLGMTDERFLYHVHYALREYREASSS